MNHYITNQVVTLPAGTELALTPAQINIRAHALDLVDAPKKAEAGKRYRVRATAPVQFKVGEAFVMKGELSKAQASMVDTPEAIAQREADAKAAAEAEEAKRIAAEEALRLAAVEEFISGLPEKLRADITAYLKSIAQPAPAASGAQGAAK